MTLGAFGVFSAVRIKGQAVETVDDLSGLGWTHPWPALALSICLLSLSGIPPLDRLLGEIRDLLVAARRRPTWRLGDLSSCWPSSAC